MGSAAKGLDDKPRGRVEELEALNEQLRRRIQELEHITSALEESEERYRSLFENAIDLIQIVAPSGKLLFVNEAWRRKFGYDPRDTPDLTIFDLIAPDCGDHCVNTFGTVLREGLVENIETTFMTKDGTRVELQGNAKCIYDADGKPLSSQCIFQDVTAQREREQEQLRADKIASLGVLAGGLAHDFNNYLTAILGNLSLARLKCEDNNEATSCLVKAERASIRAQGLARQLLTFSKGGVAVRRPANLRPIIRESAEFATRGSKSVCRFELPETLWGAEVDAGQISQTIHNLVLNASQAMLEGGTIVIRAANVALAEQDDLPLPAGDYVQITVEDHGPGIAAKVLEQIFDPYFTTKDLGSGLGLAVTYAVINKHGGHITVDSAIGKGTTFTIYLPALADAHVKPAELPDAIPTGSGHVLVMDDDPMIRELVKSMLETLGYSAEVAANGQQVVEMYLRAAKTDNPFDLLLLDLTVPGGMGGDGALQQIRETNPDAKAIISSGYSKERRAIELVESGCAAFLQKPYDLGELARLVKEVLEGK